MLPVSITRPANLVAVRLIEERLFKVAHIYLVLIGKQYVDIQHHGAHFDMMVAAGGGESLLEPGQLFARL